MAVRSLTRLEPAHVLALDQPASGRPAESTSAHGGTGLAEPVDPIVDSWTLVVDLV
jgi:hypothetical protein